MCNAQYGGMSRPVSTAEAAAIIEIDRSTLSRWVKDGRIAPLYRVGSNDQMVFDRTTVNRIAREYAAERSRKAS